MKEAVDLNCGHGEGFRPNGCWATGTDDEICRSSVCKYPAGLSMRGDPKLDGPFVVQSSLRAHG